MYGTSIPTPEPLAIVAALGFLVLASLVAAVAVCLARRALAKSKIVFFLGVLVAAVAGASGAQANHEPTCAEVRATIVGTAGDDVIVGTHDEDVIVGLAGNDTIDGLDDDDLICGGEGNDVLRGGPDDDAFLADAGDDTLDGGPGDDVAVFVTTAAPVTASLKAGTAIGDGADTLAYIEALVGSQFPDTLEGNDHDNYLDGQAGDDSLAALEGEDALDGDAGNDVLDGGVGDDVVFYDWSPRAIRADLSRGTASGWGTDRLVGIEDLHGSRFGDVLVGNAGPNWLTGHGGNDSLAGSGGNDVLYAEGGNDVVTGGPGADRLDGGPGRDRLNGGPGRDRCVNGERKRSCP